MTLGSDPVVVSAHNLLGVEDLEVTLPHGGGPPLVLCGRNAVGKTSFLTGLAALLGCVSNPLHIGRRKDAYLRDGSDRGNVSMWSAGREVIRWVLTEGTMRVFPDYPDQPVLLEVLGLSNFRRAMSPSSRNDLWESLFLPDTASMEQRIDTALEALIDDRPLREDVLSTLRVSGWTAAEKHYRELAKQARRDWKGVTGETYGEVKARTWRPSNWHVTYEGLTHLDAIQQCERADAALQRARQVRAVSESQVERAKLAEQKLPEAEAALAAAEEAVASRRVIVNKLARQGKELYGKGVSARREFDRHKSAWPVPEDRTDCPSCGTGLVVMDGGSLRVAEDGSVHGERVTAWEEKLRELKTRLEALRREAVAIKRSLETERTELAKREGRRNAAADEVRLLKRDIEDGTGDLVDDGEVANRILRAEEAHERAKASRDAVKAKLAAEEHHSTVSTYGAIYRVLGPSGPRGDMIRDRMGELHDILGHLGEVTGWGVVELDQTYVPYLNSRPVVLCSGAERRIAQFMLQVGLAVLKGQPYVLLDAAELLDDENSGALGRMLEDVRSDGVHAVLTTTVPDRLPDGWEKVWL